MDKLSDAVKDLKINNTKYYESNTANASDAQGDHTHNPETVTNTINGNETVIHTNNRSFQKKLLSNRTIPVVVLTMNPSIDHRIAPIVLAPQTLLATTTKKGVADATSSGASVNSTLRQVSHIGVKRSTSGNIGHDVSVEHALY